MKKSIGKRVLSLALVGAMMTSTVAMAANVPAPTEAPADVAALAGKAYTPIQLEAAPTKIMDYYATAQTPGDISWVANYTALDFMPAAAIGDVTCAVEATDGAIWVGTENGLMRMDFTEPDARDMVQYFAGNRYLYNGDDHVTGLAADDDCGVWVRNASGAVHIKMPKMTMEERTYFYEKMINDVNDRRGMITDSNSYTYDPATGEYTQASVSTNDNDGLWSAMYAMGEILRYRTLKRENAPEYEIAAAKAAATRATKAVLLLDYVSGRGNGFPCRSYMLKNEHGAQVLENGMQRENGFWFEMKMLGAGEEYPDPIIAELKQDGDPIGIATVRITGDSLNKKGSRIFAGDTDYNGVGLSASSIAKFNEGRTDGNILGEDIYSNNGHQVFPVMMKNVNNQVSYIDDGKEKTYREPSGVFNEDDVLFRLTAPVYEQIPTIFNDLFPASAINEDGNIDMEQIVYKADTSSDEVDGHYALFLTAYRYLCDEAEDAALKNIVAEACTRMTDLILEDDRYYIVDATGKSTQWSRWLSRYFNDGLDQMKAGEYWTSDGLGLIDGEDALSYGYEDASLNALEVMAALKTAAYIAEGEGDTAHAATYNTAYAQCFESPYSGGGNPNNPASYVNGKGYIDMAMEHIERRIIRQNNDAYGENDNQPVREYTPGNKIFNNALHDDWTQYVNYSDEELGWFPVYALVTLEEDAGRHAQIVEAYDLWYDGQEEREENPFYTFLYQLAHPEKNDVDLQSAVRYFYRSPLLRNNQMWTRGDRQDVLYIEAGNRDKMRNKENTADVAKAQTNYALPLDEMNIGKDNGNPFARFGGYGEVNTAPYTSGGLDCSTVFTLPYWLGRYYGMITEAEGSYYERVTPEALIDTNTPGTVTVTVTDGSAPLERMIVDFYEGDDYIGRARTNADGVATLFHAGTITATVTERLIGDTMYNQTKAHNVALRLSVPEDLEMVMGEHHSIDFVILPETNQQRGVAWASSDESVATMDKWGRVTAVSAGDVTITATSKANGEVTDTAEIKVVATVDDLTTTAAKDIVIYTGDAAEEVQNLQKYVDRFTKVEALADGNVPQTVTAILDDATAASTTDVESGTATWSVEDYGIKRVDSAPAHERDAEQLFMGNRYLPDGAIIHIEDDGVNGLWVVSDSADATAVTHIRMEELSYTAKAAEMSATTQKNVARRGMVSEANWNGTKWIPAETDNDGLWTSMYGVGELMRYAVLKEEGVTGPELEAARKTALSSIKAVLLLSNISCREGEVEAYVRPLKNEDNWYLNLALLKDGDPSVNAPQSGPVGAAARNGDAARLAPFVETDWGVLTNSNFTGSKETFETRTRTLEGFIARTYTVGDETYDGGNRWDINGDGTATCVRQDTTNGLPKYDNDTVNATGEIPEILMDLLPDGADKSDIVYKADTSTDEIIGHLFIYKVAYDILGDTGEEGKIKALLVDTVRRFAQHMADNGYTLRDATGQGTSWGKTERDYFNNSYAWEDCALNSLVNLCTFKLAGYVTGEARWENEYRMLALDDPYRYADLAGEYWDRWEYLARYGEDGLGADATQAEVDTWIQQTLNYSDEEMAMEAYYLLFQMEKDEELIGKYQDGIDSWWNSMQYSENPLWYYIYQLAYPTESQVDAYGNDLVDTAAWALSRHPIDTVKWCATDANRPDVRQEGELSFDAVEVDDTIRVAPFDERAVHKYNGSTYMLSDDNPNQMEGSTTYTLPYWLGRYHGMITPPEL